MRLVFLSFILILSSCHQLLPPPEFEKAEVVGEKGVDVSQKAPLIENCTYSDKSPFIAVKDSSCYHEDMAYPKDITGMTLDSQNNIYVTTKKDGLFIGRDGGKTFQQINFKNGLEDELMDVKVYRDKIFVISKTILYRSEDGGKKFKKVYQGFKSAKSLILYLVSTEYPGQREENLFILEDNSLHLFKNDGAYLVNSIDGNSFSKQANTTQIYDFFIDIFNNSIRWNLLTNLGVFSSPESDLKFTLLSGSTDNKLTCVNRVKLLFCGPTGMFRLDKKGSFTKVVDVTDLNRILVDSTNTSSSSYYLATSNGLLYWTENSKNSTSFQTIQEDLSVTHVLMDSKGRLYAATADGLMVWAPTN